MEFDLKKVLEIIWKKKFFIIAAVILFTVAAFLFSNYLIEPKYSATTSVYVFNDKEGQITQSDITFSARLVQTYIVILKSDQVLSRVAAASGLDYTPSQIGSMITASQVDSTEVFKITVTSPDPAHSAVLANTIISVGEAVIMRVVKAGSVEVIDSAPVPKSPSSPNVTLNVFTGAFLGLVLSIMLFVAIEFFDNRIKDLKMVTDSFNIPVIGVIPSVQAEKNIAAKAAKTNGIKEEVTGG